MVVDVYGDGEESVRCRRRKESTIMSECHMKDQDSNFVNAMI